VGSVLTESLRERQKQVAREAILQATAVKAAEVGSLDFSIGDVATQAGVAYRTVYNHFESREGLIDGLSEWIDEQWAAQGGIIVPQSLRELPEAVRANFLVFEEQSDLAEVMARLDPAERATKAQERRSQAFSDVVASAHPELSREQQESFAVLLRQIASVRNWYSLTRAQGLSASAAGAVAAWAIEQIIGALDRGELPDL